MCVGLIVGGWCDVWFGWGCSGVGGEHRLGEGMRRGVFCLGLVPVATGLTLREAMWMQCCLTAGVEPGPMPAHAFRRADRHAVEDAMGVAPGLMRAMAADAKRRRRMVDADEEGVCPSVRPPRGHDDP